MPRHEQRAYYDREMRYPPARRESSAKTSLFVFVGFIGFAVSFVLIAFLMTHAIFLYVVLALIGLVALLGLFYGGVVYYNRLHAHNTAIRERRMALQAQQEDMDAWRKEQDRLSIEAARAWQLEQSELAWKRQREQEEAEFRRQQERERLELERQRVQLEAYKAQAIQLGRDQALVIRDYNGLGTRTAYEPLVRVREVSDKELVNEGDLDHLLAAPRRMRSALALLQSGELDESDLVLGIGKDGEAVHREWKIVLAVLILGLMGGGKTNTTLWLLVQLISKGYRVALIDRHAKHDESTHARLKVFSACYDTPVGNNPQAALRVLNHVKNVFLSRRDQGAPVTYNLVFAVDEFTATIQALDDNEDEWYEVAVMLKKLLSKLISEGRKFGVFLIAAGQATNAATTGGTAIRDLFPTRLTHGMRAKQAQMLGLTEEKKDIQKLETGQVFIDMATKDDPFFATIPEVTEEFIQAVLHRLQGVLPARTEEFYTRSTWVPEDDLERSTRQPERLMNGPENQVEPLNEIEQRVYDLRKSGTTGKAAIIWEIWEVKKGGSDKYKQADHVYTNIMAKLEQMGLL